MSKLTAAPDLSQVKPEDVARYADLFAQDVVDTVNGDLDFDSNFNAKEVTATFSAANTDLAIQHNLGRTPVRYIVTSATTAMSVYNGSIASTSSILYLRSSATGVATLLIY